MDKSPLKTLTLEDFLESERQKLTGTLTPVTPETFAKWKKERLDKKQAELEAMKAREDSGRALFEKGDWQDSGDEDGDDEDDDFARLRLETEEEQRRKEEARVGGGIGLGEGAIGEVPDADVGGDGVEANGDG